MRAAIWFLALLGGFLIGRGISVQDLDLAVWLILFGIALAITGFVMGFLADAKQFRNGT